MCPGRIDQKQEDSDLLELSSLLVALYSNEKGV
jgi:hypothetical protein